MHESDFQCPYLVLDEICSHCEAEYFRFTFALDSLYACGLGDADDNLSKMFLALLNQLLNHKAHLQIIESSIRVLKFKHLVHNRMPFFFI
jgi:hypothetical protein